MTAAVSIGLIAIAWGCGGHSGTTVNTAGYQFVNFDYTNAAAGTMASGINNNGIIVGYTNAATKPYTSFFRNTDGSFTNLSPTPTIVPTPTPQSTPVPGATPTPAPSQAMNVNGVIVNTANALGVNDANSVVGGITAAGVATLTSTPVGPVNLYAFETLNPVDLVNSKLAILPIPTPTTTSQTAFAINNSGVVVGQYFDAGTGSTPGYVYANQKYTILDPAPALTIPLPSGITFAQGINNNGIVVGSYAPNGSTFQQGFAYSTITGKYTYLPNPVTSRITSTVTLASVRFMAINDNNMAAGYYQVSNGCQYAFIFNLATQAYTYLDAPDATVASINSMQSTKITGINNAGTLCGTYTDGNYATHAFIATLH